MRKLLLIIALFAIPLNVSATKCYWTAAAAGQWDTASNWEGGDIPDAVTDTAFFMVAKSVQNCTLKVNKAVGMVSCSSYTGTFVSTALLTVTVNSSTTVFDRNNAINVSGASGAFRIQTNAAVQCTVGSVISTASGAFNIRSTTGGSGTKFYIKKIIHGGLISPQQSGSGNICSHIYIGDSVKGAAFQPGAASAGGADTVNYGSTIFDVASVDYSSAAASPVIANYGSSKWIVAGNWTNAANVEPTAGTSTVTITNTATITTANKTAFYDLIIDADTKTITFADSLKLATGGDYLITAGDVTHSTKVICSQGDITNNSTGTFVWPTTACLRGANYNLHIDASAGVQTMESTVFVPYRTGTFDIDKLDTLGPITALDSVRTTIGGAGNAFYSVLSAKNFTTTDSLRIDSLYMPDSAGVVLKSAAGTRVNKTTAAILSGAAGKLNYYSASTPGSAARLYLPAAYTLSYASFTDITVSPAQVADATVVNGGGNTGFTFPTTSTRRRSGLGLNTGLMIGVN